MTYINNFATSDSNLIELNNKDNKFPVDGIAVSNSLDLDLKNVKIPSAIEITMNGEKIQLMFESIDWEKSTVRYSNFEHLKLDISL